MDARRADAEPLVSVILPVFNGAATLRRSLDSVLGQTLRDLEILIVDDGSSDGSTEIATSVRDARLRCLRHDRNLGASAARNTGVRAAAGRYVAFIDADDEWLPEKLARQHRYLEGAAPGMPAACTGFVMRREGKPAGSTRIPETRRGWATEMLDVCSVAPGSTLMVERKVFDEIGLLCTELGRFEDWDWLLRYFMRYDLGVVPEPLAVVHSSPFRNVGAVDEAARRLLLRQQTNIRKYRGVAGLRTFKASLWIERSVARWRDGRRVWAVLNAMNALFLSPARFGRFLQRCSRKVAEGDA